MLLFCILLSRLDDSGTMYWIDLVECTSRSMYNGFKPDLLDTYHFKNRKKPPSIVAINNVVSVSGERTAFVRRLLALNKKKSRLINPEPSNANRNESKTWKRKTDPS